MTLICSLPIARSLVALCRISILLLLPTLSAGCPQPTPSDLDRTVAVSTAIEEAVYFCGWVPRQPAPRRILADLVFNRATEEGKALPEDVSAVRDAGATLRHVFHVAAVRAEIATDQIPTLAKSGSGVVNYAIVVTDPNRDVLEMQVFFSRPLKDSDVASIEQLGARVIRRFDARRVIYVEAPDSAVPQLRTMHGVRLVRATAKACGTAE